MPMCIAVQTMFSCFSVSHYFDMDNKRTVSLVRKLVETGCDLNIADSQGWTPLYQSAFAGDLGTSSYCNSLFTIHNSYI